VKKYFIFFTAIWLSVSSSVYPQAQQQNLFSIPRKTNGLELGLRLFGGSGMLCGTNHINEAFKGTNVFFDDVGSYASTYLYGYSVEAFGSLEPLRFASFMGLELFFYFKRYLGFGLGLGYMMGKKTSGPVGLQGTYIGEFYTEEISMTQHVSTVPIHLTIYSGLSVGKRIRLVPYLGIGLYFGSITLEDSYHYDDEYWPWKLDRFTTWTAHTNKSTLGFHGGLNFDFDLTRSFGLFVGIGGLAASFVDLVGDVDWEYEGVDWWGSYSEEGTEKDVKLWFLEEEGYYPDLKWYPGIFLSDEDPSLQSWAKNVEPGKISLSQFRLVIGLNIFLVR